MFLNFKILTNTPTHANMFFVSTIFITLVLARYATSAKLIRGSQYNEKPKRKNSNLIKSVRKQKYIYGKDEVIKNIVNGIEQS